MQNITTLPLVDERTRRQFRRLLVKPINSEKKTTSGIITPTTDIQAVVIGKDESSEYSFGEVVTIRRKERESVMWENEPLDVVYEMEVVNNQIRVGAYTIVVKIDKRKRDAYQEKTESGIFLPQSKGFQAMKYNLQYGQVMSIGKESRKRYPNLSVGDTAILHHTVESQDHRIMKVDLGKDKKVDFEYRVINTADETNRDVFGKIDPKKGTITPFANYLFLEDNFEIVWHDHTTYNLSEYHDLESLNNRLKRLKAEAVIKVKAEMQMLKTNHSKLNPFINRHRDIGDSIDTAMNNKRDEITHAGERLNRDFYLSCEVAAANHSLCEDCGLADFKRVIVGSKILYPIKLMGKKYLICTTNDLVAVEN